MTKGQISEQGLTYFISYLIKEVGGACLQIVALHLRRWRMIGPRTGRQKVGKDFGHHFVVETRASEDDFIILHCHHLLLLLLIGQGYHLFGKWGPGSGMR